MSEINFYIAGLGLLIIVVLFYRKKKFNRHEYNWKKCSEVIEKINSFSGDAVEARQMTYLRKIDPFVFEEVLLYSMEKKGMKIFRNQRYTGDGGIDGRMIDANNQRFLIQAKRYKGYINATHVKEFGELVLKDSWAGQGLFIHTGKTGKSSYKEFNEYPIQLVSGYKLIELIKLKK